MDYNKFNLAQHNINPSDIDTEFINSFYESNPLFLLPDSPHRQYKLILPSGSAYVVKKRIRKPDQLSRICSKLTPIAVYQSVSRFLNPSLVSNRGSPRHGGWKKLSNWFLGSDLFIDVDSNFSYPSNLLNILNFVKRFPSFLVSRTGHGYHFWVFGYYSSSDRPVNPLVHERSVLSDMESTVSYLKSHFNLLFDFPVSIDTRRVARVPGSLHYSSSTVIWPLAYSHRFALDSGWGEQLPVDSRVNSGAAMIDSPAWDRDEKEWLVFKPSDPVVSVSASRSPFPFSLYPNNLMEVL